MQSIVALECVHLNALDSSFYGFPLNTKVECQVHARENISKPQAMPAMDALALTRAHMSNP
jgi:hypothetical protein